MEIFNDTQFTISWISGRISFPGYSLTFICKSTFEIRSDQKPFLSKEQLFSSGDEMYPDDEKSVSSYRYESDFGYFKPRADLLLAGKCYNPNGTHSQACRVTFQVGGNTKSLAVFGNRYWKSPFNTISEPEPFSEMELRYENSYGGDGYSKNPLGKGYKRKQGNEEEKRWSLPNIENIQYCITSTNDRPEPAGFGPLGNLWHDRFSKMGTYNDSWLKERWPWFARDFDWSYFNAAPSDMQVEGYLKGDEKLYFENLHPIHSHYRSQLPGLRVRLFVNALEQKNFNDPYFKEVTMNLDTLWVDMEAEKFVLLWRGVTNVQSEDFDEILHIFIVSERLEEPKQSLDYYHKLFLKKLAEEEEDGSYEIKPIVAETEDSTDIDEEIAKAEAERRAAGIDPVDVPDPTPEQKAEEAQILKEMGYEEETEEPPLTLEIFLGRVKQGGAFTGEDLRVLDLSALKLEGVNLQSTIISGGCLKKANLSGATLTETNLSEADLSGANLKGANLKDADLTGANLQDADLTGAFLEDAIFEKAQLDGAILDQVMAKDTNFSEANLTEATLTNSKLSGADFSKANLEKADFQGANLCEASVEGATGKQVNMSETDLTELRASENCDFSHGSFRKAKGRESIWEGAKLTGADFTFTHMEGADFTSADLETANLSAASMKFTRFTKANLKGAKLIQMNLFQGSLEKADLTGADFRSSNLYGVEFLDSCIEKTCFEFTNLKMTNHLKG